MRLSRRYFKLSKLNYRISGWINVKCICQIFSLIKPNSAHILTFKHFELRMEFIIEAMTTNEFKLYSISAAAKMMGLGKDNVQWLIEQGRLAVIFIKADYGWFACIRIKR